MRKNAVFRTAAFTDVTPETVESPVYGRFPQRLTTAAAGVRFSAMLTETVGCQVGAAIEHDLRREVSAFAGLGSLITVPWPGALRFCPLEMEKAAPDGAAKSGSFTHGA